MSKHVTRTDDLCWKIHTPAFLDEVVKGSGQGIYRIPIILLKNLLGQVAERASMLNDDELNSLMCKLGLYAIADGYDKENYDPALVTRIIRRGEAALRKRLKRDRKKVLPNGVRSGGPVGGAAEQPKPGDSGPQHRGGRLVRDRQGKSPAGTRR